MSPRVYKRKFDHDEAIRLRKGGWTYQGIALKFGVSDTAVYRAVNPAYRERMDARAKAWRAEGVCPGCGGPATRIQKGRREHGRCRKCFHKDQATSVRPDTLQCFRCREWKPDEDFPSSDNINRHARRGRHSYCRDCNTIARREYRKRNPGKQRAYDREYKRKKRTPLQIATSSGKS